MKGVRIGVDLGGTKIEAVALSRDGEIVARQRVPTPQGDYLATVEAVATLIEQVEHASGARGSVGVGLPGAISAATGRIKNANSTWLNDRPFGEDLSRRLGRAVRLANDANCLALSEASDGAAAGASIVFAVIIGTGTGGGLVVNGQVLVGANAIAGEWGHNPLPWPRPGEWPGPACYCGRTGCIETFLSGPGLSRDFAQATGQILPAETIVARADAGDLAALMAFERYEDRCARALAAVINLVDPDVIVLGGGLSNIRRLYTAIPARWPAFVFSDVVTTRLVAAAHGATSGVRGAAWLWPESAADVTAAGAPR